MTNRDRILNAIQKSPGVSDAELRRQTGIEPHQQVNQICRKLEAAGIVTRRKRQDGRIGNYAVETDPRPEVAGAPAEEALAIQTSRLHPAGEEIRIDPSRTLVVIPCSAAKVRGGSPKRQGRSAVELMPAAVRERLVANRKAVAQRAQLDESLWLRASRRYSGRLYQAAEKAIPDLRTSGAELIVISGGYGVVLADEPIGYYNKVFRAGDWPNGIIGQSIIEIAGSLGRSSVIGVFAGSSGYAGVFRRIPWPLEVLDVRLVAPERRQGGAMIAAPEAQGEILSALSQGELPADWTSKRGLGAEVEVIR